MSEEGGSSGQGSCGQLNDVTHDLSEPSRENGQLDVMIERQDTLVQQPEDIDDRVHTKEGETIKYRETSPTLELTDLFDENRDDLLNDPPSARANISDTSSQ